MFFHSILVTSEKRIAILDGLRSVAIILVIFRHTIIPFWHDLSSSYIPIGSFDLGAIFLNGWMGVDLFFILSGFLITLVLLKDLEENSSFIKSIKQFYIRRFFRIAPIYFLILLAVVYGLFPFYTARVLPVSWSLIVEFKFYLIAPFLIYGLLYFLNWYLRIGMLLIIILMQPLIIGMLFTEAMTFDEYFINLRMHAVYSSNGLLMGVLAGFLWKKPEVEKFISKPIIREALFLAGLSIFMWACFFVPPLDLGVSVFNAQWMIFIVSLSFFLILLGLLGGSVARKFFEARIFGFLALISYSAYLVHYPLLFLMREIFINVFNASLLGPLLSYGIFLLISLAVCIAVSTLLYVFIEKPCIAFAKRIVLKQENCRQP